MGETGFFWWELIVTSPKNVKTLHEQIIADIYKPFSSSADIRNFIAGKGAELQTRKTQTYTT